MDETSRKDGQITNLNLSYGMTFKYSTHPDVPQLIENYKLPSKELGFGKLFGPVMFQRQFKNNKWHDGELLPYGPIMIDPAAKVLHYAQEIFEGMKAYRGNNDKLYLFRPDENAKRFNLSAERMCMPTIPVDEFLEAIKITVQHSLKAIPNEKGTSLYIRPFMMGTEPTLGVRASTEYMFMVIVGPAGNYFSGKTVKLRIEREAVRATEGGTGFAKAGGNYAASLKSGKKTDALGCDQTLWLDAKERRYIEEASGMNFCAIIDGALYTPELTDTILPGITRKSLLTLAKDLNIKTVEKRIDINWLKEQAMTGHCTEAFLCGTASVIAPISSFHEDDGSIINLPEATGKVGQLLKDHLIDIQMGFKPDTHNWVFEIGQ